MSSITRFLFGVAALLACPAAVWGAAASAADVARIPGALGLLEELATAGSMPGVWRPTRRAAQAVVVVLEHSDRGLHGSHALRVALARQGASSWLLLADDPALPALAVALAATRARAAQLPLVLLTRGELGARSVALAGQLPVDALVLVDVPDILSDAAAEPGSIAPALLGLSVDTLVLQRQRPAWWLPARDLPANQEWQMVGRNVTPEALARRLRGWLARLALRRRLAARRAGAPR